MSCTHDVFILSEVKNDGLIKFTSFQISLNRITYCAVTVKTQFFLHLKRTGWIFISLCLLEDSIIKHVYIKLDRNKTCLDN